MRIETQIKNMPQKMMEREKCKESLKRVSQGRASEREDRQKQIERDKVSERERQRERERERQRSQQHQQHQQQQQQQQQRPTDIKVLDTSIYIYILPYNNTMAIDIMAPCDTEALHSTQKLHVIIAM